MMLKMNDQTGARSVGLTAHFTAIAWVVVVTRRRRVLALEQGFPFSGRLVLNFNFLVGLFRQ